MKPTRIIRRALERAFGIHLLRYLPRGANVFHDIRSSLHDFRSHTVLDVGANVGRSALEYVDAFPEARIHCFEPTSKNLERLVQHTKAHPRVIGHHCAVGATEGEVRFAVSGSRMNRVITADAPREQEERVRMVTVDGFMATQGLEQVSYMKVDTEGHDLEVLRGANSALIAQRIDLVEVEAGMSPDNRFHVPFHELDRIMTGHGYRLFGLYEQIHEWTRKAPQLRRANAVYLSAALVEAYSGRMR